MQKRTPSLPGDFDSHSKCKIFRGGRGASSAVQRVSSLLNVDTVLAIWSEIWKVRAILMQSLPKFLHGVCRFAMRQALDAVKKGHEERFRGWKLFFLVPRLLLFRPKRSGLVPGSSWRTGVALFHNGEWDVLLEKSLNSSMDGATGRVRRRRNVDNVEMLKAGSAHGPVGELSAGRQALEGASLAPGDKKTLEAFEGS